MRNWHRRVAIFVGLFLLIIACTGVWLQIEEVGKGGGGPPPGPPGGAAMSDAQVQALVTSVLAGAKRIAPQGQLLGFELRLAGPSPMAEVVVIDAAGFRKQQLDARTGEPLGAAGDGGLNRLILEIHKGDILGRAGNWIGLFCGIALAFFAFSGLWVYVQMWRRRRTSSMRGLMW
jgi:uncharacterized iron-regulated membrane protein